MSHHFNGITIEVEVLGDVSTNSYLVYPDDSKECVLIDLGAYPAQHLDTIRKKSLDLKYILFTHGHYDHIKGLDEIPGLENIQVMIHEDDAECITQAERNLSCFIGKPFHCNTDYETYDMNSVLKCGQMDLVFFHTPGHTAGSVCIQVNETLFTGDTIFKQSVGRTDLPGGDYDNLMKSITKIKESIPHQLPLFPGHGENTSLQDEISRNPFFQ